MFALDVELALLLSFHQLFSLQEHLSEVSLVASVDFKVLGSHSR